MQIQDARRKSLEFTSLGEYYSFIGDFYKKEVIRLSKITPVDPENITSVHIRKPATSNRKEK